MKKKYLPLYYEWMKTGRLPHGFGLCREFYDVNKGINDPNIMELQPIEFDDPDFVVEIGDEYWASGARDASLGKFTPLRQTILLFVAAKNGEL
jgi:hypothetical protein